MLTKTQARKNQIPEGVSAPVVRDSEGDLPVLAQGIQGVHPKRIPAWIPNMNEADSAPPHTLRRLRANGVQLASASRDLSFWRWQPWV